MKGGLSRTSTRTLTGIDKNRKVSELRKLFEPKKTQKKATYKSSSKKSKSRSSESRSFQPLKESIEITNKNCPNRFHMHIRNVNKPQMNGHEYTLIIKKEDSGFGCKYPLVIMGNKLQIKRIESDSKCTNNDKDIKSLIEHIDIELDNRGNNDMFSSIEELNDFLTLQIKVFCPAGMYKSIHKSRKNVTPPTIPSKMFNLTTSKSSSKSPISNRDIEERLLSNPTASSAVLQTINNSSSRAIPSRFSINTPASNFNQSLGLMSEKGSNQKMIKDRLEQVYVNVEKTELPSVRTEQNQELYDTIKSLKETTTFRVKGLFTVIEKFYNERKDRGQFLLELNDIAAAKQTKKSREISEYGHNLIIIKLGKNEKIFKKVKGKFDGIIRDLEIGFRDSITYEDLIINLLRLIAIFSNEFIAFIVNSFYFDFIELAKLGFFNEERALKYSKIISEELKYGTENIIKIIDGRIQQTGLTNTQLMVSTLVEKLSKPKHEVKNKEYILEELHFLKSCFNERVKFFQDAVTCIKNTVAKAKDGISSYKEKRFIDKKYVDTNVDTINELKLCMEQQMVTSDTKDELCKELKKSKGLLKKLTKKNRFRQKAHNKLCKNEESIKTKKNLLKTIKRPLNFLTRRINKKV